jgi:hypothetical protein
MVTRSTYGSIYKLFHKLGLNDKDKPGDLSTYQSDVETLIRRRGYRFTRRRFSTWRNVPGDAVAKVNRKSNGAWHWVVVDRSQEVLTVHDPKPEKPNPRQDLRGLRGFGEYLIVMSNKPLQRP